MRRRGGLVPQQIAPRTGIVIALIALARFLPDRKRDAAVRMLRSNRGDQFADFVIGVIGILAALQDKCPVAERIALFAAVENLLICQAVALCMAVARADAAVIAVVFAVVRKLDQAAQKDRIAVPFAAFGISGGKEFLLRLRLAQECQDFRICQIMCCPECFK